MTDDTRPTEPIRTTPPGGGVTPGGSVPPGTSLPPAGSWQTGAPFAAGPAAGSPFQGGAAPMPGSTPVAPVVVAAPRRRSTASTFVNVLLGVAVVVAVGGVAFAAGRATAPASTGTGRFGANGQGLAGNGAFGPNASGAPGRSGFGGAFAGGGGLSIQGTVTAVAADSITIELSSGQTLTIPTDAQTTYHTQAAASASDVTSGSTVIVQLSGGRFVSGGGATNGGQGTGNGTGGSGGTGNGTGNQGRGTGSASSITVVPSSS